MLLMIICVIIPGYNWSSLATNSEEPPCNSDVCMNGGECLPAQGLIQRTTSVIPEGTVYCLCKPGFTSPNCGQPMSSCSENPCRHGAQCVEDPSGGTGYICNCENTGYEGRHCELEKNLCVGSSNGCRNSGTCLMGHLGFLCECPGIYIFNKFYGKVGIMSWLLFHLKKLRSILRF